MKLLWTISNWKRTGPLEPSLDLAAAMVTGGHDVHVAVGRAPAGQPDRADVAAEARGLRLAATGATLAKHSAPLRNWRDVRRLRHWIAREHPTAIVTTQRNDHVLALRAAAGVGVPVVRLWFGDGLVEPDARDRKALVRGAGALVLCERAREQLAGFGLGPGALVQAAPPLDVEALRARAAGAQDLRGRAGVPADHLLVGIVARMQTHRRFEMLWDAVAAWKAAGVPASLVAIGRGTHEERVAREPVRRMGLGDVVHFAGYLRGEAYARAVAALEAQILLVPGSDPTCRALREGMALGVPVAFSGCGEQSRDRENSLVRSMRAANVSSPNTGKLTGRIDEVAPSAALSPAHAAKAAWPLGRPERYFAR